MFREERVVSGCGSKERDGKPFLSFLSCCVCISDWFNSWLVRVVVLVGVVVWFVVWVWLIGLVWVVVWVVVWVRFIGLYLDVGARCVGGEWLIGESLVPSRSSH